MAKIPYLFVGVAALVAAVLASGGADEQPAVDAVATAESRPLWSPRTDPVAMLETALAAVPVSAAGDAPPSPPVEVPGAQVQLRALFERSMMYTGERPMAMIMSELEQEIEKRVPPSQLPAARVLLEKYARYRTESTLLENAIETAATPQAMRLHIEGIRELRGKLFSQDELASLFPADEAYEAVVLARMEIRNSATLSEEEKEERAAALEASLSPQVVAAEALRNKIVRLDD